MTQQLQTANEIAMGLWDDPVSLADIKAVYQKKASDSEFKVFVQMGKATGLNPFLGEIWLVKYDQNSPAQIFIGRDGYRKSISRNPDYDGHHVEAVYSNDDFQYDYNEGKIYHKKNFKEQGSLVGAYCVVHLKSKSKPYYVWVNLNEYNTGKSTWGKIAPTMIKKVAEAQCVRMASPEIYNGTHDESEAHLIESSHTKVQTPENRLERIKSLKGIEPQPNKVALQEILDFIDNANNLDELKAVTEKVKKLTNNEDIQLAREAYKGMKEHLEKIASADYETGEIPETVPLSECEKVKNQLLMATSKDFLDIAADLIVQFTEDEQIELKEIYAKRCEQFG